MIALSHNDMHAVVALERGRNDVLKDVHRGLGHLLKAAVSVKDVAVSGGDGGEPIGVQEVDKLREHERASRGQGVDHADEGLGQRLAGDRQVPIFVGFARPGQGADVAVCHGDKVAQLGVGRVAGGAGEAQRAGRLAHVAVVGADCFDRREGECVTELGAGQ